MANWLLASPPDETLAGSILRIGYAAYSCVDPVQLGVIAGRLRAIADEFVEPPMLSLFSGTVTATKIEALKAAADFIENAARQGTQHDEQ